MIRIIVHSSGLESGIRRLKDHVRGSNEYKVWLYGEEGRNSPVVVRSRDPGAYCGPATWMLAKVIT